MFRGHKVVPWFIRLLTRLFPTTKYKWQAHLDDIEHGKRWRQNNAKINLVPKRRPFSATKQFRHLRECTGTATFTHEKADTAQPTSKSF